MNDYIKIVLKDLKHDMEYYINKYPKRDLKEGEIVTRFAPSPTGFVHFGSLFTSFVSYKVARQTNGVFFLRIEDTDQKRSVENGISSILKDLKNYGIEFDEGPINDNEEKGNYGPYIQSNRKDIYQAFVAHLLENDLAYPCFCKEEELEEIRKIQEERKDRIGYYGKYARDRYLSKDEVIRRINNGEKYVIRLKSNGDFNKRIVVDDKVKGKLEFPENDLDIVILKQDGIPTYHFAHLVDDYLMGTNYVIRGDEWVSSLPIHIQLFQVFNYKPPKYAHLSPLMKDDEGIRRKLSKRKDPESAVSYYHEQGIPVEAVKLYIMTVANSNFEMWYEQNQDKKISDFTFDFKKVSSSGSLFDLNKLLNISKNYISKLKATEVYEELLKYTNEFDKEFEKLLIKYKDYSISIFDIERNQKKPRKDYAAYSMIKDEVWYMYDELFNNFNYNWDTINDLNEIKLILNTYINEYYSVNDDKDTWFNKIKELSKKLGYCDNIKEYKENPTNFKGHVGDVSMVLRIALTSKTMTPDLYEIMKLLGKDRIIERFNLI